MTQDYQQSTGSIGQQTYGGQSQQQPMGTTSQQPQSMGSQGTQFAGSQGIGGSTGTQMGQTGGQMGQPQTGSAHQTTHQKVGQQFESELTPELNEALEAFDRVVEISSWCADKCIESGPQMAECARLCLDLAELAELNEKLIARDSINGPEFAETFLRVAQQGIPILQQQQSPHVQETLQAVSYAIDSTEKLLNSIGGQQQLGGQQGFQEMAQQSQGSQQFQQPQGQSQQYPPQESQQYQPQGGSQQYQPKGGQFQSQQPQSQQFQPQSEFQGGHTSY